MGLVTIVPCRETPTRTAGMPCKREHSARLPSTPLTRHSTQQVSPERRQSTAFPLGLGISQPKAPEG